MAAAAPAGVPGWAFADGNLNRNSAAATAAYQYICAFILNPPVANLTVRWNNGSDTAVYMWFRDGIEAHYHPGAGQPGRIKYAGAGSLTNHDLGLHINELPGQAGFAAFLAARVPGVRDRWV